MDEQLEENEEELIQKLMHEFLAYYGESNPPHKRPAQRGTHPKTVALTCATFSIEPELPEFLRVGFFKQAKRYTGYVRFSQTFAQDDRKKDNRSLSIKLSLPNGGEIDFLMRSTPTFYVRTIHDFYELVRHRHNPIRFFFPSLNPLRWRLKELWLITSQNRHHTDLLTIPYYGEVPYLFGPDQSMKFMVVPSPDNQGKHNISPSPNFLHEGIQAFLKKKEARFDFLIQLRTDPERMPIEDATVKWRAPFYKVATLELPIQEISDQQDEELAFSPWHTLPEHRPLGGINRARKHLYDKISQIRHQRNQETGSE